MTSTNYASKIHTYHGHTIYPCEHAKGEHQGRWTILTYHKTGMPYSDESCPHFWTLTAAKEFIERNGPARIAGTIQDVNGNTIGTWTFTP